MIQAADTVAALLEQRCRSTPQAVAFQEEVGPGQWRAVSWQGFSDRVARLRQAMHAAGLRKGDRLALIAPVSLQWECLHHAALGLGVVVVGLDAHDLPARIASMLALADVTAIACGSQAAMSEVKPERLVSCKLRLSLAAAGPADGAGPAWLTWAEFEALATGAGTVASEAVASDAEATSAVTSADLATIIFTSGTSGAPKGIGYSHGQVCLAVLAIGDAFAFAGAQCRVLCWLPLSNLFQRMVNLAALRQGTVTYLLDDPRRVMRVVADVAPDVFIGVPRFFEKLHAGLLDMMAAQPWPARLLLRWAWQTGRRLRACEHDKRPPPWTLLLAHRVADRLVLRRVRAVMGSRLQCMVSGSAPMSKPLLDDLHALGWLVLEAYGLSENILPMAMNRVDDFRLGTVGHAVPGNDIRIDESGAIRVRGPGVFTGYVGEADAATLDAQGYHHTGDLGSFDSDGYLHLSGRSGDLFKTSTGRRVAPAGVEAVLRSVPGIDQALLLGAGRKCPVAICTCTANLSASTARGVLEGPLRAQLAAVAAHDRPGAIGLLPHAFSIEHGELTPNLKLRRDTIAQRHAALVDALYAAVELGHSQRPDVVVIS